MSAADPSERLGGAKPSTLAGPVVKRATKSEGAMPSPFTSAVHDMATAVSSPEMPFGADLNSFFFFSSDQGAWSVAIASMRPFFAASATAARSSSPLSGGFTFAYVSYPASRASVRARW